MHVTDSTETVRLGGPMAAAGALVSRTGAAHTEAHATRSELLTCRHTAAEKGHTARLGEDCLRHGTQLRVLVKKLISCCNTFRGGERCIS